MPELRSYQIEDANYLARIRRAACFNEQRTGKAPTALKITEIQQLKKVLIICPTSAMYQWKDEFEKWLNKPCVVITGTKEKRVKIIENWTHGAVISYDTLKIKNKLNKNKLTSIEHGDLPIILKQKIDGVILDEAHRIKERNTATAKAVFKLTKIPNRIALSATPAPNRAYEIWAILHFLYPETFKSYWAFIDEYFGYKENFNRTAGKAFKTENSEFYPTKQEKLQRFLNKISTNRKRIEVMPWLPDKDYTLIRLPASPEQSKHLNNLEKYYETENIITQGTLDRLVRYRQICLHPFLCGLKGASPKLEWLNNYIQDYPNKPIIIFSKFTTFLKHLFNLYYNNNLKVGLIIGDTNASVRNLICRDFQTGKLNILLLNIDACKEALTLDRAETTIFTDLYPPIGDIKQAEDRFIATSEIRAKKPHNIIQLIIRDTYDEELYNLVQKRANEVDVINNFKKYIEVNYVKKH